MENNKTPIIKCHTKKKKKKKETNKIQVNHIILKRKKITIKSYT